MAAGTWASGDDAGQACALCCVHSTTHRHVSIDSGLYLALRNQGHDLVRGQPFARVHAYEGRAPIVAVHQHRSVRVNLSARGPSRDAVQACGGLAVLEGLRTRVGHLVVVLAPEDLGRNVGGRAHRGERPLHGAARLDGAACREVTHLGHILGRLRKQHVTRFQVAVEDVVGMQVCVRGARACGARGRGSMGCAATCAAGAAYGGSRGKERD